MNLGPSVRGTQKRNRGPGLRSEVQVRNEAGGGTCAKTVLRHRTGWARSTGKWASLGNIRVYRVGRGESRKRDREGKARQVRETQGASCQGKKRESASKGREEPKLSTWVRNKKRQASECPAPASSVAAAGDTCSNGVPHWSRLRNSSRVQHSHHRLA